MATLRKVSRITLKYTALAIVLTMTMSRTALSSSSEPLSQQPTSHQDAGSFSYEEDGYILVLDEKNLHQAIKQFELLMVNFYITSHAISVLLEPEFSLTAELLRTELPSVRFAKMAAGHVDRISMKRYRMSEDQPCVILFREGHSVKYDQPLTSYNMAAWLRRKTGEVVTNVRDRETVDRIIRNEVMIVIGLFKGEGRAEPLTYLRVAEEMEKDDPRMRFLITENSQLFNYLNVTASDSAVVLLKKFDDGRSVLTENLTKDAIRNFLKTETIPSLVLYTKATSSFVRNHEIEDRLLLFINFASAQQEDRGAFDQIAEAYAEASKLFTNKVLFVVFDVGDGAEGLKELDQFGSESDCPLLVFFGQGRLRRSPNSNVIQSKDDIQMFIQEVLDYKAETMEEKLMREPKIEL